MFFRSSYCVNYSSCLHFADAQQFKDEFEKARDINVGLTGGAPEGEEEKKEAAEPTEAKEPEAEEKKEEEAAPAAAEESKAEEAEAATE